MSRPKLHAMPHIEARKQAETQARQAARGAPVVEHCSICGTYPAPFGYAFGSLHACMDRECQATCEARAYPKAETGRAA